MAQFQFSIDQKCTIWHKTSFNIEANTKEEAIEFLKEQIQKISSNDEILELPNVTEIGTEYIYDTVEYMSSEENGGSHVFELMDDNDEGCPLYNEFGQEIG
jgi:hypothetical protein